MEEQNKETGHDLENALIGFAIIAVLFLLAALVEYLTPNF